MNNLKLKGKLINQNIKYDTILEKSDNYARNMD